MTLEPFAVEAWLVTFAVIVLTAYVVQTVTGFGSMLIAVTFGALLMPIRDVMTLALPLSILQVGYIAARHRSQVRARELGLRILPIMLVGVALGFFVFAQLSSTWLRPALGVIVLLLAGRELLRLRNPAAPAPAPLPRPVAAAAVLSAGVLQGIYATGGPLLVYVVGREGWTKGQLRATLSTVWLLLNTLLVASFWFEGRYEPAVLLQVAALIPTLPLGLLIGEAIHARVDERRFRFALYGLLVVAALSLLAKSLWGGA